MITADEAREIVESVHDHVNGVSAALNKIEERIKEVAGNGGTKLCMDIDVTQKGYDEVIKVLKQYGYDVDHVAADRPQGYYLPYNVKTDFTIEIKWG